MLLEGSCALDWDGAAGFELSEGRRNAKIWLLPVLASSHTKVRFASPAVFLGPRIAPNVLRRPFGVVQLVKTYVCGSCRMPNWIQTPLSWDKITR